MDTRYPIIINQATIPEFISAQSEMMEEIMPDPETNQLLTNVAHDIVAQAEPAELPLFRAISTQYFKKPEKLFKQQHSSDDKLGFGTAEAITMATPALLVVMSQLTTFLVGEISRSMAEKSAELIAQQVKKMFKRSHKDDPTNGNPPITLTQEQLAHIRQQAYDKFIELNLSPARAARLADAVLASLIVPSLHKEVR